MPPFWCGGADTWNAKTFPYWELKKRQNLLLLFNFKNYTLYFSNSRTKGWALIIFCKTKPLHIYLNRPHFTRWDEHIGISGGKIQLAAFHCSWGQSLKVELPGECSSLLSHVSVRLPCWGRPGLLSAQCSLCSACHMAHECKWKHFISLTVYRI